MNEIEVKRVRVEAIKFILENAQRTTTGNYAVFGTITPEVLSSLESAIPDGKKIFDKAIARRDR